MLSRAQRQRIERIARGRSEEPLRLLEGIKSIRDALAAGHVRALWLRDDLDEALKDELSADAERRGLVVEFDSPAAFDRLASTQSPQGALALVTDTASSLEDVARREGLLLWLDGVQDPGNVGAVVRVAAGLGAAGLLVGEGTADPLGLKALRASAGLALGVPFARANDDAIVEALAPSGRPVWTLEMGGDDVRPLQAPPGLVLVLGAEGRGVGERARAVASRAVEIPLAGGVESLNVAVAAGIALAFLTRSHG